MGKGLEQTFPQRHTNGLQADEKMLNFTNYQGNTNQNYNVLSPHTCLNGDYQKDKQQQVLERL